MLSIWCAKIWNNVSVKGVFFLVFFSLISHWLTIPLKTLYQWTEAIKCTQQNKARKIAWSKMENGIFCIHLCDIAKRDRMVLWLIAAYHVALGVTYKLLSFIIAIIFILGMFILLCYSLVFFCDFSICLWLACASFIWQYLVRSQGFVYLN